MSKDLAEALRLLERVKQACLFDDDDNTIGVTCDPYVSKELFDDICKFIGKHTNTGITARLCPHCGLDRESPLFDHCPFSACPYED